MSTDARADRKNRMLRPSSILAAAFAAASVLASCKSDTESPNDALAPDARESDAADASDAMRLDDPAILGVLSVANQGEVDEGNIALGRAVAPPVKMFATQMVTAHNESKARVAFVASELGASPDVQSALAQSLQAMAEGDKSELYAVPAADFDRLYMQKQLAMHQMLLGWIDDLLLPSASRSAAREELQETRAAVTQHIAAALEIVCAVSDGGACIDPGAPPSADAAPDRAASRDAAPVSDASAPDG
jgi:putative membrane protein